MPATTATDLLDLSFLYSLAENDTKYIYEVIGLYIKNMSDGLAKLEKVVRETNDFETMQRSAHALKSSAGIVKVRDMYNDLVTIETAARNQKDNNIIIPALDNILKNFREALPLIQAELEKNRP